MRNALLIIDMQNAWIEEASRFEIDAMFKRINALSERFRQQGLPVIFIQHETNEVLPGTRDWQMHEKLSHHASDYVVNKTACDSFADTSLTTLLETLGCCTLSICGLATEFCVDTSLRSALSRGFDVIAFSDAHTTADRAHLTAESIVRHHSWIWTNLALPAQRQLRVLTSTDFLAE